MALVDPTNNDYDVSKLQSASIIGHVTPTTARVWIRVYRPGEWTLVWTRKRIIGNLVTLDGKKLQAFLKGRDCATASHSFREDEDLTHTFDLPDLSPDTEYFYYLMAEDDGSSNFRRTEIGCYKTLSLRTPAKRMVEFSFGFYSCHDPYNANGSYGAWPLFVERMDNAKARFAIGGGDQVYVDSQESKYFPDVWKWLKDNKDDLVAEYTDKKGRLDEARLTAYLLKLYRWYYRVYWKFPHLQDAFARYPQYMIWDDHEIMDGWGSRTNAERIDLITRYFKRDDPITDQKLVDAMWAAARTAYFEYVHSHNPDTGVTRALLAKPDDCIWDYSFDQGGVPFYVLDLRGHHDVESPEKKNFLLGGAQLARFESWLSAASKSTSPLLFVVSPVPFVHWKSFVMTAGSMIPSAKDDVMDEWDHPSNHAERDHLLEQIFKALDTRGKTLVFVSGDVHCAAAFRLSNGKYPNANICQVTSSAISRMPAGRMASSVIARSGTLYGNDQVYFEHLFSHSEDKNFALFKVGAGGALSVELCWPGGVQGEAVVKNIRLR